MGIGFASPPQRIEQHRENRIRDDQQQYRRHDCGGGRVAHSSRAALRLQAAQAAATRFETAWDQMTGTGDTIVAVLDTGVRFEHPDLGRASDKTLDPNGIS